MPVNVVVVKVKIVDLGVVTHPSESKELSIFVKSIHQFHIRSGKVKAGTTSARSFKSLGFSATVVVALKTKNE